MKRPNALCIAAHDPSAGAGLLADIKTLESHDVYGCGITTGITFQNDIMFQGVEWMQYSNINSQLLMVSERFDFEYAKIGMIKDLDMLDHIIALLYDTFPVIKIIWDPVMSTSSGFQIHFSFPFEKIIELARDLYLMTPNMEEIKMIFPELSEENGAKLLAKKTNVLLKGGHAPGV